MNAWRTSATAMTMAAVVAAAGCVDNQDALAPLPPESKEATAKVELSSLSAAEGEQVSAHIVLSGARRIDGGQGVFTYDATSLEYVGQAQPSGNWFLVNAERPGTINVLSMNLAGLPAGDFGTLVFKVRRPNYGARMGLDITKAAALESGRVTHFAVTDLPLTLGGVVPAGSEKMDVQDHLLRAFEVSAAKGSRNRKPTLFARPGEYRPDLRYGDITLDGGPLGVDFTDALATAAVANGISGAELIFGTDDAANDVDYVIAGNVYGEGSATDTTGVPGFEGNPQDPDCSNFVAPGNPALAGGGCSVGTERLIDFTDALLIAGEANGTPGPIVGNLIPGRSATPLPGAPITISGDITTDVTWNANQVYRLDGIVRVRAGGILRIQPGARIEGVVGTAANLSCAPFFSVANGGTRPNGTLPADAQGNVPIASRPATCTGNTFTGQTYVNPANVSALFIERDGQIFAEGTETQPIVMTCAGTKAPGCWGGLFVAGNAPTNQQNFNNIPVADRLSPNIPGRTTAGCLTNKGEGGAPLFGGCNPDDNSGVLRYLIVEYGGYLLTDANELNNITLSGVGRGTVVEYVQAHGGSDDGIELFGGTVDMKYLIATDNDDDQFDISQGWVGRTQFLLTATNLNLNDKSFEWDNVENDPRDRAEPWRTAPEVYNVTSVSNNAQSQFNLRVGVHGWIRNAIIFGGATALDIDDSATCVDQTIGGVTTNLFIENSWIGGQTSAIANTDASDPNCAGLTGAPSELAALQAWTDNTVDVARTINPFGGGSVANSWALGVQQNDFRPRADFDNITGARVPTSVRLTVLSRGTPQTEYNLSGTPATATIASLTRPEFFDASANFKGAFRRANATGGGANIDWASGWMRRRGIN